MASLRPSPASTRVRCSERRSTLVSPLTVAGRVRPTQLRSCACSVPQTSLPVVERLDGLREAQNSIVPAPTLGFLRPIEEVGAASAQAQSTPPDCQAHSPRPLQVDQEPPVPLYVSLCDEIVAACHRQPEVSTRPSMLLLLLQGVPTPPQRLPVPAPGQGSSYWKAVHGCWRTQ